MKKSKLIAVLFLLSSFSAGAQFVSALGAAAGVSYSKEGWNPEQWATQEQYLLRYNGAVLAEFFTDPVYRWRAEIMYNALGTKEVVISNKYVNATNYISLNNYLKYQREFFKFIPYILIGPRVEYLFSRNASVFPDAIAGMSSIHISAAAGAGVELVSFSRLKPFIEVFYNRDLMPSLSGTIASNSPYDNGAPVSEVITNHDFELRIGFKYVLRARNKCPRVINPAGNPAMPDQI